MDIFTLQRKGPVSKETSSYRTKPNHGLYRTNADLVQIELIYTVIKETKLRTG